MQRTAKFAVCLFLGCASGLSSVFGQSFALRFSADGQRALVPDSDSLDVVGAITIEAWIKPDAEILSRGYTSIMSKQLNGTGYMLASNFIGPAPGLKSEIGGIQVTSTSQPIIGNWQHIAAVWDGELKFYFNGQLDGVINSGGPIANPFALWIGSSPFGSETSWRGVIDELRIWEVARTQAEIQHDMQYYLTGNQAHLRAYWPFDEGSGQSFADLMGANPGQLGESLQPDVFDPAWVGGVQLAQVPEPSTFVLAVCAVVTLVADRRRRGRVV